MLDTQDQQVKAMRRQIRFLWAAILALVLGLFAIVASAKFSSTANATTLANDATTLTLISSKTGNHLVMDGDGLRLQDKEGHVLLEISDLHGTPQVRLTQWQAPSRLLELFGNVEDAQTKHKSTWRKGVTLTLKPRSVLIDGGYGDSAMLTLEMGPTLTLHGSNGFAGISTGDMWVGNECNNKQVPVNPQTGLLMKGLPPLGTSCYETHVDLGSELGLSLTTCKKINGQPVNAKDKNEGCESVQATSFPLDGQGAHVSLSEDGNPRLILGGAMLTGMRVGGQEFTPLSQITAFDKKGYVVWKIPEQ
ncbi:MAG TPA: hypothetical protein VJS89_10200 [Gammaproteobacteria bacterium]|nr:hypothetical protein [Gammaproteobacteria bacterium]